MRHLMRHYQGAAAEVAYLAFDRWNGQLFGGKLPVPLIVWGLVPHGKGVGWARDDEPPVMFLHPAILKPATEKPWGLPKWVPGPAFAADVVLRLMCSVVSRREGDWRSDPGRKSYWNDVQNPSFVGVANRVAEALGYGGSARYGMKGVRRAAGKPGYGFLDESDGPNPLSAEGFPWNLPGRMEGYRGQAR